jgi:hypothetical protein
MTAPVASRLQDSSVLIQFDELIRDNWGNPPRPPIDDNGRGGGGGDGEGDDGPLSLHQKICLAIAAGSFLMVALTCYYVMFAPI